jgi:hypothetical protein
MLDRPIPLPGVEVTAKAEQKGGSSGRCSKGRSYLHYETRAFDSGGWSFKLLSWLAPWLEGGTPDTNGGTCFPFFIEHTTRICRSICAPRCVHCIRCCLTIRLLTT